MEAFAITRSYYNYEDSYTHVIAICYTEDKCKEVIEKDKKKDNHPLMDIKTYYDEKDTVREAIKHLCKMEKSCPKKGGFLNKFHYEQLNKTRRHAYDVLKEKSVYILYYEGNEKEAPPTGIILTITENYKISPNVLICVFL